MNAKMNAVLSVAGTVSFLLPACTAANPVSDRSEGHVTTPPEVEDEAFRPNILLIMTDQQSFNTISALSGAYPGTVYSNTPNIDRLVRSGVSFTQAYCANPVSVPSRFTLFTGMYGGQFGVRKNSDNPSEGPIRELQAEKAMGTVFRNAGYETVYGGKVHLPYSNKKAGASSKFAAPDGYGFDAYLTDNEREGLASATAEFLNGRTGKNSEKPFIMVASFLNPHDICVEYSANVSDEVPVDPKKPEKSETIQSIRERMSGYGRDEFLGSIAPALPDNMGKTEGYPDTKCSKKRFMNYPSDYWRQYRWVYGELVSLVDSHIGVILDALDANPELKENTLVVFTSDHGEMQGAHGTGTKSLPFDECQRVPFIFAGYGVDRSFRSDMPVCNGVDLIPTLCEMCGVPVPEGMDGLSLASVIKDGQASGNLSERKYIYSESETFRSVYDGTYKLTHFDLDGGHDLLVNLTDDSGEMKNIASDNASKVEELKNIIFKR